METLLRVSMAIVLSLLFFNRATTSADDKPTPIATAAAAVEANMKTRDGKVYDGQIGKDLAKKYPPVMKLCKDKAGGDTRSFDMLVNLDKNGAVKEVLLHPQTKISQCLRETMLKDTFSPPPKPSYWVDIHIDVKH